MNYTRLLILVLIAVFNFGMIAEDNRVYMAEDVPEVLITAKRIVPDSLKADQKLLARLIYAEAGGEDILGMRAVADVVIYRMEYHGSNMHSIIYADGEFDGIFSPMFYMTPSPEAMEAARKAILGYHILPYGILFYHNPVTSTDRKWTSYIEKFTYKDIGNHRFCWHPEFFS